MLSELDTHDWHEVFGCAGEDGAHNWERPEPTLGYTDSTEPFTREDVEEILAMSEGENDGPCWMIAVRLKDGRYAYIEAGCDYTGWDCCSNGSSWVASSLNMLRTYGLTESARDRLSEQLNKRSQ